MSNRRIPPLCMLLLSSIVFLDAHAESYTLSDGRTVDGVVEVRKRLEGHAYLSLLGIEAGKTTLSEATKILGLGTRLQSGDASTAKDTICYVGKDGTALILESGEIGGASRVITSMRVIDRSLRHGQKESCARTHLLKKSIGISKGLRLGISAAQVEKYLGKPSWKDRSTIFYLFVGESDGFDLTSAFEIGLSKDRVVRFNLSHLSTN